MIRRVLRSGEVPLEFVAPGRASGERVEFDDTRAATTWLARYLADPSDALRLRGLAGELGRGEPLHDDRDVLARIAAALVSRRVALVESGPRARPIKAFAAEEAARGESADAFDLLEQKPVDTHWIEIQLIGEDGEGIAGQRCRLVAGDGAVYTGHTDATGVARWTRLPPGACRISFPDLDVDAVEALPES